MITKHLACESPNKVEMTLHVQSIMVLLSFLGELWKVVGRTNPAPSGTHSEMLHTWIHSTDILNSSVNLAMMSPFSYCYKSLQTLLLGLCPVALYLFFRLGLHLG